MEAVKTLEQAPSNVIELTRAGEGAGTLAVHIAFTAEDKQENEQTTTVPDTPIIVPQPRKSPENEPWRR